MLADISNDIIGSKDSSVFFSSIQMKLTEQLTYVKPVKFSLEKYNYLGWV